MINNELLNKIIRLCEPIVIANQCELYHLEYIKESGTNILRLYIDKNEGINLTDCERVSRAISEMLDIEDPIEESYCLEVSSPGIDRVLYNDNHLNKYIGDTVIIKLAKLFEGKKQFQGELAGFTEEIIKINIENIESGIPRDTISKISLKGEL